MKGERFGFGLQFGGPVSWKVWVRGRSLMRGNEDREIWLRMEALVDKGFGRVVL
jgi:hypothetical protein